MITPIAIQTIMGIYAVLLAVGGVIGFVKAGSNTSLIAGVGSALLMGGALGLTFAYSTAGLILGSLVALALVFIFASRYYETRKVMPAGIFAVLSLLVAFLEFLALAG